MFSMGGRQREERQLKVPDFDDDLSFNPVAGDDKFILDDSIWKKVIQNYDVINRNKDAQRERKWIE